MRAWCLTSSPTSFLTSFLEGVLVWSLWLAALPRGDANPSCLSQLDGFTKSVAYDAVRLRSYAPGQETVFAAYSLCLCSIACSLVYKCLALSSPERDAERGTEPSLGSRVLRSIQDSLPKMS